MQASTSTSTSVASASPTPRRDSLGCSALHLQLSQELQGSDFSFYRKRVAGDEISQVRTSACGRGFLLGISMSLQHRRSIFRGRQGAQHDFERGSIYLRDFSEDYRADIHGAFDFLLVELPSAWIDQASSESGRRLHGLRSVTGQHDPVLQHLAQALAPALARPHPESQLFADQLGAALGTHVLQRYGGAADAPARSGRLSRQHEERAKMMLLEKAEDNLSITAIASACNMSASHFLRAFKASTGRTPHQWLLMQRVEMARYYLRCTDLPLAEVAVACDFYDQSHFSRVFSQVVGSPPGAWRRGQR